MKWFRYIKSSAIVLLVFSCVAAYAQTIEVKLHVDNDGGNSGCDVTLTSLGLTLQGVDVEVTATVDRPSRMITDVTVSDCDGTSFSAPNSLGGNIPLGLNNGTNGSDVVEFAFNQNVLLRSPQTLGYFVSAQNLQTTGQDLAGVAGNSETPVLTRFFTQQSVPTVGLTGLVVLSVVLLFIGLLVLRRKQYLLAVSLLSLAGICVAANFVADGNVGDWNAMSPVISDPPDDVIPDDRTADIQSVFLALENGRFFVRTDIADLENAPPEADDTVATVLEDNTVSITLSGSDMDGDSLVFEVATPPINGSLGAITVINPNSASVIYTPDPDFNGADSFTFSANDALVTSPVATVGLTVTAINDAPSFTKGADQNVLEDAGAQSVAGWATGISAGPANEAGQTLTFNITGNTNAGLFTAGPAIDAAGNLTYTTTSNTSGSADITIELMDDGGTTNGGVDTSAAQTFTVNVTAVNSAPSFTKGADETVLEDAGAQSVAGWATAISAGPADEAGQVLTFNVTGNTNPALFASGPAVDATGTLTYTPAVDANGTADITVELMDDGGTANGGVDTSAPQTFTINVTAVNDAPSFTKGADQNVQHDAGPRSVDPWATGINVGPANESGQTASFNVTNNTLPGIFASLPAVSSSGVLTYEPQLNANGTATITLNVMDDGGTLNGGDDTSAEQSFDITVLTAAPTANDDTFAATGNVGIDFSAVSGALFADNGGGADDDGGATLVVSQVQGSPANVGVATATTMGGSVTANADGSFSYTPLSGYQGADSFTYTAMNSGGSSQATVTVNVSDMIWFIDNSASAGDGGLNTPLNSLVAFEAVNGNGGSNEPAASDCIFVYGGGADYSGPVTLENNQVLVGQGASDTVANICGITLAVNSNVLPATSGSHPVLISASNAVNLASGNTIRGLNIGDISGTGIHGTVVGHLSISDVSIGDASPSGGGIKVTTSGTLDVTFDNLSASSSAGEGIYLDGVSGSFVVSGTGGVIQTTAFPAIDIDGNPGLATAMTFARVSANGGSSGIILSNTTGSFTVTGDGSTPGSGGTIQNMAGADGSNAGIGVRLNNTENVALNFMQINNHSNFAVRGTTVSNFDLNDSVVDGANGNSAADNEGSISFTDLTGVANITGSTVAGGLEDNVRIINNSGTLVMTFKDSATPNDMIIGLNDTALGNDGIRVETTGIADVTLLIDGVEFLGARGDMVQTNAIGDSIQDITIQDSLFLNSHSNIVSGGGGITLTGGSASSNITVGYLVDNNTFSGANGDAVTANFLSNQGTATGIISGNSIGSATPASGSISGSGIAVGAEKNGVGGADIVHTVMIDNNSIQEVHGFAGIEVISNRGIIGAGAVVNTTVTNNWVSGLGGFAFAGMYLSAGGSALSGDFAKLCSDIRNNTIDASGVDFSQAVFLDQISADANHNLPGTPAYTGSPNGESPPPPATPGTASVDIGSFLTTTGGNVLTNGTGALYPGGVDASIVVGVTGTGTSCQ